MLNELFPKAHTRYASLPILGSIADDFTDWLRAQGYCRGTARLYVRTLPDLDHVFQQQGWVEIHELTRQAIRSCRPAHSQENRNLAAAVHALERYLEKRALLSQPPRPSPSPRDQQLADYRSFLEEVRGLAPSTVRAHLRTVARLLDHVRFDESPMALQALTAHDIEGILKCLGAQYSRASLQHTIAHIRGFLRFGTLTGGLWPAIDWQVDIPRVFRREQLPRAWPWEGVCTFLDTIDRTTSMGIRDYAIFLLIATYGLRACDILALTLDDVRWRQGELRVAQRKTGHPLVLPLTNAAGAAVLHYLRDGRPQIASRQLFLRVRAPMGPLKATAINDAFEACYKRSGLTLPTSGVHGLRHSYALHLLRQGTSLKTISDLLGHRSAESTCVYLRLDVEDLRQVALALPSPAPAPQAQEGPPC
jgi:site-specific recombinase XerD